MSHLLNLNNFVIFNDLLLFSFFLNNLFNSFVNGAYVSGNFFKNFFGFRVNIRLKSMLISQLFFFCCEILFLVTNLFLQTLFIKPFKKVLIRLRPFSFKFGENNSFGSGAYLGFEAARLFKLIFLFLQLDQFEIFLLRLHILHQPFEYPLLRYLNLRSRIRIQL